MAISTAHTEPLQPAALHNAPALFGLLVLPYGFTSSVTMLLMPYLSRKCGDYKKAHTAGNNATATILAISSTGIPANGGFAAVLLLVALFAGHHWHHRDKTAEPALEAIP